MYTTQTGSLMGCVIFTGSIQIERWMYSGHVTSLEPVYLIELQSIHNPPSHNWSTK